MNIFQQIDPHCHHRHNYAENSVELLHQMQHEEYKNIENHVQALLFDAKNQLKPEKEILAYHLMGNSDFFNNNHSEAIKKYEHALELARKNKNDLAFASIGFDLIRACNNKHKYETVFKTLNEIIHIYKSLDLIDEKIHCLIQLSHYYRMFGNNDYAYRSINLAKNLHETLEDCSESEHHCVHHYYIKIAIAHLIKKSKNYEKALEIAKSLLKELDLCCDHHICDANKQYLQSYCLLLMEECLLETKNRENSIVNLDHLRKQTQQISEPFLILKYDLLRLEHEFLFENKKLTTSSWLEMINNLYQQGEIEFCLDQFLRVLSRLYDLELLKEHENLLDVYQTLLQKITRFMPSSLIKEFQHVYEFKQSLQYHNSHEYQMKKFIEMGHELFCEHNVQDLAQKILHFIISLSKMERGFVKLFDTKFSETILVTHCFEAQQSKTQTGTLSACEKITSSVLEHNRPFVKSTSVCHDLFHLSQEHNSDLLSIDRPTIIILPLTMNGENIGVVYLDSKSKNVIKDESELEVLESLITLIANIIHNAPHLEQKKEAAHKHCNHNHDIDELIEKYSLNNFIGLSEKRQKLIENIQHTLNNSVTVTLTGPSGVGKELLAKMIHYNGERRNKPFIAINCASIPENLLETELFGYKKGAFTDAKTNKPGLFLFANTGTIFLDEIGEMPLSMQVKLLRVLQEKEIVPVGDTEAKKIDVRIICATNRNLEKLVKDGLFRDDLYYRISVINIPVPSLIERKEDIPLLVDHALRMCSEENAVPQKSISNQALAFLMGYAWPGNVRELVNVMYNMSIFVDKPCIELADLEERKELFRIPITTDPEAQQTPELQELSKKIDSHQISLAEAKQEFEKLQIERALKIYNGQITSASYHLQMPRPQVSRLVKKYKISKNEFKE